LFARPNRLQKPLEGFLAPRESYLHR